MTKRNPILDKLNALTPGPGLKWEREHRTGAVDAYARYSMNGTQWVWIYRLADGDWYGSFTGNPTQVGPYRKPETLLRHLRRRAKRQAQALLDLVGWEEPEP